MKEIQAWLGHSTIGTTANIYTHLDGNSKINSANAIIGILEQKKGHSEHFISECPLKKWHILHNLIQCNAVRRSVAASVGVIDYISKKSLR